MWDCLLQASDFLVTTLERMDQPFEASSFLLSDHTRVSVLAQGIIQFEPLDSESSSDFLLSCGIHGNETAPIELMQEVVCALLTQEIQVKHRVQCQFGNLPAIKKQQRFIDYNLNRLFSGDHDQKSFEVQRALELKACTKAFFADNSREHFHFDLHTSIRDSHYEKFAVLPFLHQQNYDARLLSFLHESEVKAVLLANKPAPTYSYFSSSLGALSMTIELGKVMPFGQNDLTLLAPFKSALIDKITTSDFIVNTCACNDLDIYQVSREIYREHDNFCLNFSDDIKNFTTFQKNDVLAYQDNEVICVENSQEAIAFPNASVPIGDRALLTLVKANIANQVS